MLYVDFAQLDSSLPEMSVEHSGDAASSSESENFPVSTEELIRRACNARNGEKFQALWEGRWEGMYPSQSEAELGFCSMLSFWTDKQPEWVDHVFRISALYRSKWDEVHFSDGSTYGQRTIAKGIEGCQETYGWSLPIIDVRGGGLSDEASKGEAALIAAGVQIFQRDKMLVRPVTVEVDATHGARAKVTQLIPVTEPYLIDQLCRIARWRKYDSRTGEMKFINPSPAIAKVILSRSGEWQFPSIVAVINTPTLRPDGSLLIKAGYDQKTSFLLVDPPMMPDMPEVPTVEDARAALVLIDSLLGEFPFTDEESKSVTRSAIITAVVRGLCTVVPLHVFRSPGPGSGKSFCMDLVSTTAIGQLCPVISAGKNEEEMEKRLGSALIACQPIISFDNVNGDLGGDALCQAIERPIVKIRILGKSELVHIEARACIYATGNNIRLVGDMTRRVIQCTLDPKMERPEQRIFQRNPVAEVLADRGKFIAAALTIVRAYIIAGKPNPAPRLASFEAWSDTVRSALIWLGCADPVKTMEAARQDDPLQQTMVAVFSQLWSMTQGKSFTAGEIIQFANEKKNFSGYGLDPVFKYPELRDVLMNAIGGNTGHITAKTLGNWLSRHKGRMAGGLRLDGKGDNHGHAVRWWMTQCG